ncbi:MULTISPECIES: hypothetical protein [unclassified Clostridium]|uniref:hypothetical protein n=1 Tax=unclassified Clostridium TaxID=2614128 RepID=UPI001DD9BFC4|nr:MULTISPECIES: hypothetical protein [unclassified Clostridium]MBN1045260.1 hypothetical protein [Clostridium botulinum]MBN1051979.1 hypothetical protein [Clostridium botulinum]
MIKIKLNDVLLKDNIIYCLVIDLENNNIETFGNKDELKYDGLLKTHFYDMDTIYNLNDFLERQQLPKLFKQGEVVCIICKPQSDIIVGLLYHEERNFMECYKSVKEINKEINLIW